MEVTLIDYMGDDLRVVNSARVSFSKESEYIDKVLSDKDKKLLKYLAKHNHWTPFSHVQITMREKVPIFVARQRFKHMVGFTYNEVSRRYVNDAPEFYKPDVWRKKAEDKKQGSSDEIIDSLDWSKGSYIKLGSPVKITKAYKEFLEHAEVLYQVMINNGVAPEQARMILPQSMYTEYYVTGSLAAWARAYKQRIDAHAQREIQDLAKMWNEKINSIGGLKYSWSALID